MDGGLQDAMQDLARTRRVVPTPASEITREDLRGLAAVQIALMQAAAEVLAAVVGEDPDDTSEEAMLAGLDELLESGDFERSRLAIESAVDALAKRRTNGDYSIESDRQVRDLIARAHMEEAGRLERAVTAAFGKLLAKGVALDHDSGHVPPTAYLATSSIEAGRARLEMERGKAATLVFIGLPDRFQFPAEIERFLARTSLLGSRASLRLIAAFAPDVVSEALVSREERERFAASEREHEELQQLLARAAADVAPGRPVYLGDPVHGD